MIRKKIKLTIITVLCFSFNPIYIANAADPEKEYVKSLVNAWKEIENFNYEKAENYANSAESLYNKTLIKYNNPANSQNIWKWRLSQQISLIKLYLMLSSRFSGSENYNKSLLWAKKAENLNKWIPLPYFHKSQIYFNLHKPWDAAVSCYEAKRLNRFPVKRKIIDFFDPEDTFETEYSNINDWCNDLLQKINKPLSYPININIDSGKEEKGVLIPGVGANILSYDGNWINVYLGQNVSIFSENRFFGEPKISDDKDFYSIFNSKANDPLNDYSILFDADSQTIEAISADSMNYFVKTPYGSFRVGDHAKKLIDFIGKNLGFKRYYSEKENYYREIFSYDEIGLDFYIGNNDKIISIRINKTERIDTEPSLNSILINKSSSSVKYSNIKPPSNKIDVLKQNMHELQKMVEIYGVDWGGGYPPNLETLKHEAINSLNPYWEDLINPFTSNKGIGISGVMVDYSKYKEVKDKGSQLSGLLIYEPVLSDKKIIDYYRIWACDENGKIIDDFVLSNR